MNVPPRGTARKYSPLTDGAETDQLEVILNGLDFSLSVLETLDQLQPLTREHLQRAENFLKAVYGALEMATYRRGMNIQDYAFAAHPIVVLWGRWETNKSRLDKLIDKFQGQPAS